MWQVWSQQQVSFSFLLLDGIFLFLILVFFLDLGTRKWLTKNKANIRESVKIDRKICDTGNSCHFWSDSILGSRELANEGMTVEELRMLSGSKKKPDFMLKIYQNQFKFIAKSSQNSKKILKTRFRAGRMNHKLIIYFIKINISVDSLHSEKKTQGQLGTSLIKNTHTKKIWKAKVRTDLKAILLLLWRQWDKRSLESLQWFKNFQCNFEIFLLLLFFFVYSAIFWKTDKTFPGVYNVI